MKIINDIAVIDGDTHHAKWIEECGKLEHDQWLLSRIKKFWNPKEGDVAVDAGAHIGTHTSAYVRWVGDEGQVWAFEPNWEAFKCLKHNCRGAINIPMGLAMFRETRHFKVCKNAGASYIDYALSDCKVEVINLDFFSLKQLDFMKIDVEGFEPVVLCGAAQTIQQHKPKLCIEVNQAALERNNSCASYLFNLLENTFHYKWEIVQPDCTTDSPQYDIFCTP